MRFEPGDDDDARTIERGPGGITLWFPAPGTVAAHVRGHVLETLAAAAFDEVDRHAAKQSHPGRGFVDLSGLSGFDWGARLVMVRWNVAHRREAVRLHVLSPDHWSTTAALRALATVLRGRLVVHREPYTFDAAFAAATNKGQS
jgi:hypothetical protein